MTYTVYEGSCLDVLSQFAARSVQTCITSPPYWRLRDYHAAGQLGQERTIGEYVGNLVAAFRAVRRVLKDDGTLWVNIGDSHCRNDNKRQGLKKGDLAGVPWELALALRADGWHLRSSIIWEKSNVCPESVLDRPTRSHEYVFLFAKSRRYYYDQKAIREPVSESSLQRHGRPPVSTPTGVSKGVGKGDKLIKRVNANYRCKPPEELEAAGRNKRDVWHTSAATSRGVAHFATFPPKLIEPCVLAGSPLGGLVLDIFNGSGTTGDVALRHGREYIGIEINPEYAHITRRRLDAVTARLAKSQK